VSDGNQLDELLEAAAEPAPAEFQFQTKPPRISFLTERVPPPAWLYVGPDDRLRIEAATGIAGVTLRLDVRLLLPDGQVNSSVWTFQPTDDSVINTWWETLAEGFLLSAFFSTDSLVPPRGCWVRCLLVRGGGGGASLAQAIVMGYMGQRDGLAWPYPRYESLVGGVGRQRVIVGTDPPAGAIITETVPAGVRWKLITVRCWLITNATAGNRYVSLALAIDWVGDYWLHVPSVATQPASTTYYYNWAIGLTPYVSTSGNNIAAALPDQAPLTAGMQLRVVCGGLLAGDNFSAPRYLVEEWVES